MDNVCEIPQNIRKVKIPIGEEIASPWTILHLWGAI